MQNPKETQKQKITLELKPKIVKFENLSENSEYQVDFGQSDHVSFKTFSNEKQKKLKFIVTSCDRHVDDKDEEFYNELLKNDSDYDVVLHLGDQIYADVIGKKVTNQTYEEIVEEYRKLYRLTWDTPTKKKFLRSGSHLMIPDDHDITNNVDALLLNTKLKNVLLAGRQTYYEYQYQLIGDIYDSNGNILVGQEFDKLKKTYEFKRIGNVAIGLLDTRFQRTFEFDDQYRLLGREQFGLLAKNLNTWTNDDSIDYILICTGTPLGFFSPMMSKIAYIFENPTETYPSHPLLIKNLLKIFDLIKKHPKVKLISGDVHQFAKSKICDGSYCIDQLISSGISNGSAVVNELKLVLYFAIGKHFTENKFGNWTMDHFEQVILNNYGVINVDETGFNWHGVFRKATAIQKLKLLLFEYFPYVILYEVLMIAVVIYGCFKRA